MARPRTIITKSELAAVLGLSKARISQLYKREDFPARPDGRVNREAAVRWYRDAGLAEQLTKRGPKSRPKTPSGRAVAPEPAACYSEVDALDYILHEARVAVLSELATPAETLKFARVALKLGVSPEHAYALGIWYACQPCLALPDIEPEDLSPERFPQPSREQWTEVLGGPIDFDAADLAGDIASGPETEPEAA